MIGDTRLSYPPLSIRNINEKFYLRRVICFVYLNERKKKKYAPVRTSNQEEP